MKGPASRTVLVTGGSGFFGDVLKRRLLDAGFEWVGAPAHPPVADAGPPEGAGTARRSLRH